MKKQILIISLLHVAAITIKAQHNHLPKLTGPYLGQKPPGMTPEVFAPGIVSSPGIEFKIAFSPDGEEIYFTRQEGPSRKILCTKEEANGWTNPQPVSFSSQYIDEYPTLSPDGKMLFYQSNRPVPDSLKNMGFRRGFRFWVVNRIDKDWGTPKLLDPYVNIGICISSVTNDGTIYFSGSSPPVIMQSSWEKGRFTAPVKLDPPINDGIHGNLAACISPNNDYIIFASSRPGFGKTDLWISFKNDSGAWSDPRNLGKPVNTSSGESAPVLSPDGKYLFYSSNGDIYWVDVKIIDELKTEELK